MGMPGKRRQPANNMAQWPTLAHEALAKALATRDFCHDSYWLIDEQYRHGSAVLKGECHDLATDQDRLRFVNQRDAAIRASEFNARLLPSS